MYVYIRKLIPDLAIYRLEGPNKDVFGSSRAYVNIPLIYIFLSILSAIHEKNLIILRELCKYC